MTNPAADSTHVIVLSLYDTPMMDTSMRLTIDIANITRNSADFIATRNSAAPNPDKRRYVSTFIEAHSSQTIGYETTSLPLTRPFGQPNSLRLSVFSAVTGAARHPLLVAPGSGVGVGTGVRSTVMPTSLQPD